MDNCLPDQQSIERVTVDQRQCAAVRRGELVNRQREDSVSSRCRGTNLTGASASISRFAAYLIAISNAETALQSSGIGSKKLGGIVTCPFARLR